MRLEHGCEAGKRRIGVLCEGEGEHLEHSVAGVRRFYRNGSSHAFTSASEAGSAEARVSDT